MNKTVVQFRGTVRGAVPAGTRLNDMYEVDVMIATGGMGEIYRGKLVETGDTVAIKMIKPEFTDNESVMALFRKEASALHHLFHDSIVRNYGFAVDRRINRAFLAMEFVEGNSLAELLKTRPLSLDEVNLLRKRLAAGLQVAHEKGIVHRDISPDNILLPDDDVRKAKIIDFGIARTTKLGHATVIGDGFAGKYNYVSPEQLGMHGGDVTNRSDIYSLGLLLAESLTGTPIDMSGSQVDVIDKRRQVPDLSHLPEAIRPLIHLMLQPDPKDRPESMAAVAEWVYAPPQPEPQTARTAPRRSALKTGAEEKSGAGGKIAMIGGGAVAAAGAVAFFLLRPGSEPAPIPPPPAVVATAPVAPPRPPQPAAPAPRSGPLTKPEQIDRILSYIRYYDGDRCLLLHPTDISEREAKVEALAASPDAVRLFEQDFTAVNGFAASVAQQPLTQAQCGAVAMTHWIDPKPDPALKAQPAAPRFRSGDTVRITFSGAGDRRMQALLINEDGSVSNLSAQMRQSGDEAVLEAPMGERNARASRKLVLAIATPDRIAALDRVQGQTPEALYTSIARELQGRPVTIIPALVELQ